jgi:hypothetical protein
MFKNILSNKWVLRGGVFILSVLAGYAYYYFIGCSAGNTCPISSNPYISVIYGALIGFLLATSIEKGKQKSEPVGQEEKNR